MTAYRKLPAGTTPTAALVDAVNRLSVRVRDLEGRMGAIGPAPPGNGGGGSPEVPAETITIPDTDGDGADLYAYRFGQSVTVSLDGEWSPTSGWVLPARFAPWRRPYLQQVWVLTPDRDPALAILHVVNSTGGSVRVSLDGLADGTPIWPGTWAAPGVTAAWTTSDSGE